MKIKSVFVCVLFAIIAVFNNMSLHAVTDTSNITPKFVFSKDAYYPGQTVVMSMRLKGVTSNDKTNSVTFEVEYNSQAFELLTGNPDNDIKNGYIGFTSKNVVNKDGYKEISLIYVSMDKDISLKDGAVIFSVRFKVKKDAESGYKTFRLNPVSMFDSDFKLHKFNNGQPYVKNINVISSAKISGTKENRTLSKIFTDVPEKSWAKQYIDILTDRNIVSGIDDKHFVPGGKVTRAQFAAFIVKALQLEEINYNGEFKDIKSGDWYANIVAAAAKTGIIKGMKGGTFEPGSLISREQMTLVLMRAYEYITGNNPYNGVKKNLNGFSDIKEISSWAVDSVKAAVNLGIISGTDKKTFSPKSIASREQVSKIIVKLLEVSNLL